MNTLENELKMRIVEGRVLHLRVKGLEPPYLSVPEPKSGVSTNFTTLACEQN